MCTLSVSISLLWLLLLSAVMQFTLILSISKEFVFSFIFIIECAKLNRFGAGDYLFIACLSSCCFAFEYDFPLHSFPVLFSFFFFLVCFICRFRLFLVFCFLSIFFYLQNLRNFYYTYIRGSCFVICFHMNDYTNNNKKKTGSFII